MIPLLMMSTMPLSLLLLAIDPVFIHILTKMGSYMLHTLKLTFLWNVESFK